MHWYVALLTLVSPPEKPPSTPRASRVGFLVGGSASSAVYGQNTIPPWHTHQLSGHWPKPRTMINFPLSLSTGEAWSAQDYKRWHCLLIIEDFWGICIGNLWSEIDFCGKRVNLHKTDFTTVESYRTLRQFCTACSLVQDSIINTAATYRLDDESRCLREFRSPWKLSYKRAEREAQGRLFGFQGDLNSRGHREFII